jgi:hypothetical protein
MAKFNRRAFIEKAGLGAGALLLAPIAESLINEAHGQAGARKRVVFLLVSNGLQPSVFTPPGIPVANSKLLPGTTEFRLPKMFEPLAAHRNRMLLIEGLTNRVSAEHSAGHGALSGVNVARGTGADNGPPAAVSIDQFIANKIGTGTAMKSLLWGVSRYSQTLEARIFAAGRERPIPHIVSPGVMWERLFGNSGASSPEVARRRRPLFDALRSDIKALKAQLAPSERLKLQEYEEVLSSSEKRLALVQPITCTRPGRPGATPTVEARMAAMNELSIAAVACGLTNVVGISMGCGNGHSAPLMQELHKGTRFESEGQLDLGTHGHFPDTGPLVQEIVFTYMSKLVARMIEEWSKIKEGDKTIFDNTVIVVTSDNGEQHHSKKDRWPVALFGNAGGALKVDGRFLRYEPAGGRALVDLYTSLANAVGAPVDKFNDGLTVEKGQGALPELMA